MSAARPQAPLGPLARMAGPVSLAAAAAIAGQVAGPLLQIPLVLGVGWIGVWPSGRDLRERASAGARPLSATQRGAARTS